MPTRWKIFLELWKNLLWWERKLVLWFAHVALARRSILPAIVGQASLVALILVTSERNPLVLALVSCVGLVYVLLMQAMLKKKVFSPSTVSPIPSAYHEQQEGASLMFDGSTIEELTEALKVERDPVRVAQLTQELNEKNQAWHGLWEDFFTQLEADGYQHISKKK